MGDDVRGRGEILGEGSGLTRLSPLLLVMFAGRPAGSACSKMAIWPLRAASYILVAKAMASGGREVASGEGLAAIVWGRGRWILGDFLLVFWCFGVGG